MGPRLPGDKGPQARPAKYLTHNPFAALAAKLEGQGEGEKPAEPTPAAAEAAPPAPVETPSAPAAPEGTPTAGDSTPGGEGR
jgi:3'-5' exoribonuclease